MKIKFEKVKTLNFKGGYFYINIRNQRNQALTKWDFNGEGLVLKSKEGSLNNGLLIEIK